MTSTAEHAPPASSSNKSNGTSGAAAQQERLKLAELLRECAVYVEQDEFHPNLYQALGALHSYAGQHAANPNGAEKSNATATAASEQHAISSKHSGSFELNNAQQLIGSLGKKFTKGLGLSSGSSNTAMSLAAQQASSSARNAERVRADLEAFQRSGQPKAQVGHRSKENDWCDEHFCLGCQCKTHTNTGASAAAAAAGSIPSTSAATAATTTRLEQRSTSKSPTPTTSTTATPSSAPSTPSRPAPSSTTTTTTTTTISNNNSNKPAFQRPINPNSILIANGWIEQQRRSKMRVVWKDVLASLVEGRKAGEETTLWIQRQVINATTGKAELEALHQIPIKWLLGIDYLDYTPDHRFVLKVYNVPEEFLFRCPNAEAAQNWVLTLRSVREVIMAGKSSGSGAGDGGAKEGTSAFPESSLPSSSQAESSASATSHRMTISELRAIAHGAGINTMGMERRDLEEAVAQIAANAGGGAAAGTKATTTTTDNANTKHAPSDEVVGGGGRQQQARSTAMDEQRKRGQAVAAEREKLKRQQALEEAEQRQRLMEEQAARQKRAAAAEEAERRMREKEEAIRRRKLLAEEEERRRQQQAAAAAAEEDRLRREELRRRKLADEEMRRRRLQEQEEQRRRQQQAAEEEARRRKLAEEVEARRRAAEQQQAAEQRRRQEDAQRQRWQQQQQQQQQQQWQQQQSQQQWQQRQQPQTPQWQQQQQQQRPGGQQQQYFRGRPSSPPGRAPPPPGQAHPSAGAPSSPVNQKYAKMAVQDDDDGQAAIVAIKHNILVHWALQPPLLQMLRPIDVLVTTIHNVFPPAFGVPGHEYFAKWKAVHREALLGPGLRPDEEKMKKSVRKLRFFLHPDKLPRDLNEEQQFMCKMLWDITSDAWEEFEKHKEELDWIRS